MYWMYQLCCRFTIIRWGERGNLGTVEHILYILYTVYTEHTAYNLYKLWRTVWAGQHLVVEYHQETGSLSVVSYQQSSKESTPYILFTRLLVILSILLSLQIQYTLIVFHWLNSVLYDWMKRGQDLLSGVMSRRWFLAWLKKKDV